MIIKTTSKPPCHDKPPKKEADTLLKIMDRMAVTILMITAQRKDCRNIFRISQSGLLYGPKNGMPAAWAAGIPFRLDRAVSHRRSANGQN